MGKIVEKLLEALQNQAENTVTLLDLVLSLPFPQDLRQFERRLNREDGIRFKRNWAEMYRARQSFYSMLNQLKRDGLVAKRENEGKTTWKITRRGISKLRLLKEKKRKERMERGNYDKEKIDGIMIISFDIPEDRRQKRNWLRACLIALGFKLLHKSVWIGQTKIPEEFIRDLRAHEMISYVHIFSVDRKGTITRLI